MKRSQKNFSTLFLLVFEIVLAIVLYLPARAQNGNQSGAYYVVQAGESLWEIATRFGVNVADLQQANNISDASQVGVGMQLVIPGLDGINGRLDTISTQYGDTLRNLSRYYAVPEFALARLNHLMSPNELYAGATLIVPMSDNQDLLLAQLSSGQSLLELAVAHGDDPWKLVLDNELPGTWAGLPDDILHMKGSSPKNSFTGLPEAITKVEVAPLLMTQGGTEVIKVYAAPGLVVRGSLGDRILNFFPQTYGYVALQGIHAMMPPGLYPLTLQVQLSSGISFAFSQNVLIQNANFPYDPTLEVSPATVDPTVTEPEKKLWESLGVPVTPTKMWDGQFASPVPSDFSNCWTSLFGNHRSYNGGTYDSFHSGLDFCGQVGTELYAVAPGMVVYTNTLIVRGGVVVIDHGWGVYTAYDHLSKIMVQPGDAVRSGQVIGLGGSTGRTTGPHLHWEVWVGGVQVNPVDWLTHIYP